MTFDYAKTARAVLDAVGGEDNVGTITHCITRLRFVLKDCSKPDDKEVEKIPGVIRVIRQGGQYQVVIGNEVSCVFQEITKLGSFADAGEVKTEGSGEKENLFSRLCGFIAGCMTPLLPAMLGCGMVKVLLTLLTTFSLIDSTGSTYVILNAMGDAFFYFMPIMLAFTTAKKLGSSPTLAMVVAALLLHPDIVGLLGAGNTTYFGLPVTSASYSSSVLPVLLMVPIMKYIEKFADKVCPSMVKVFLKPLIVVFISVPIALVVIGPIGTIAGNFLADGVNFLYSKAGWLAIMVLSAAMPFIVMTGMHYALVPISTISLASLGFDAVLVTTMFCSNLAQGAASMAVAMKSRDVDTKATASAAGISAIVAGVTEPAMYGVTMKYKTPLIAAVAGAGAAGLYAGITHVVAYTMGGSPSVLSLIQMIGGNGFSNLINGAVTLAISLSVSFVLTLVLYKPEKVETEGSGAGTRPEAAGSASSAGKDTTAKEIGAKESSAKEAGTKDAGTKDAAAKGAAAEDSCKKDAEVKGEAAEGSADRRRPLVERIEVKSPVSGALVPLKDVSDPVFAEGILGEGIAVSPTEGAVYAPADGVVSAVVDTRHAVGFTTDSGVELLIHVGLDTVKLEGEGFELCCEAGDHVKEGGLLIRFDLDLLKKKGYDVMTPVLVSNMTNFISMKTADQTEIHHGETLMTIV